MTDQELDNIYKSANAESHFAGLRAVYNSGQTEGNKVSLDKEDAVIEAEFTQAMNTPDKQ